MKTTTKITAINTLPLYVTYNEYIKLARKSSVKHYIPNKITDQSGRLVIIAKKGKFLEISKIQNLRTVSKFNIQNDYLATLQLLETTKHFFENATN